MPMILFFGILNISKKVSAFVSNFINYPFCPLSFRPFILFPFITYPLSFCSLSLSFLYSYPFIFILYPFIFYPRYPYLLFYPFLYSFSYFQSFSMLPKFQYVFPFISFIFVINKLEEII